MKKISLIALALFVAASFTKAQTESEPIQNQVQDEVLLSKKGVPILPTKGNWAIGIDATPMFEYMGNLLNVNGNTTMPSFGFTAQNPGAIYAKYKKSDKTTYRGTLLFGITGNTDKSANAADPDLVDKEIQSALSIGLIVGLEKNRKMFGRLIGNYGAQVGFAKQPYVDPTTGAVGKYRYINGDDSDFSYKEVGGNTFSFMAGAFVGVEFFFAPRISLGGEFAYNLSLYTQTKRVAKPNVGDDVTVDLGQSGVSFAPAASGNLQLMFYF